MIGLHCLGGRVLCSRNVITYLVDKTCNLILIFQVSCRMQRKNHLDTSYSFAPRNQECQSKNHLAKVKSLGVYVYMY